MYFFYNVIYFKVKCLQEIIQSSYISIYQEVKKIERKVIHSMGQTFLSKGNQKFICESLIFIYVVFMSLKMRSLSLMSEPFSFLNFRKNGKNVSCYTNS